jgi:hypothetical protein
MLNLRSRSRVHGSLLVDRPWVNSILSSPHLLVCGFWYLPRHSFHPLSFSKLVLWNHVSSHSFGIHRINPLYACRYRRPMEGSLDLPVLPTFHPDHLSLSLNSVPRIITDRYALPHGADANACNVSARTWCGGTWRTIQDNLDYIQGAGFTASKFIPL